MHGHSMARDRANARGRDMITLELSDGRLVLGTRPSLSAEPRVWTWDKGEVGGEGKQAGLMDVVGGF